MTLNLMRFLGMFCPKKNNKLVMLHPTCGYRDAAEAEWRSTISRAKNLAAKIPGNPDDLTESGYTRGEIVMADEISKFCTSLGIFVSNHTIIEVINNSISDEAAIKVFMEIEQQFIKAHDEL